MIMTSRAQRQFLMTPHIRLTNVMYPSCTNPANDQSMQSVYMPSKVKCLFFKTQLYFLEFEIHHVLR